MEHPSLFTLLQQFHAAKMPRATWTHEAHLRVAASLIWFYGRDVGLNVIRDGIKKLNASFGGSPDGYHETVTRAFTTLIDSLLSELPLATPIEAAVDSVAARLKSEKNILGRHYDRETLDSREAHQTWILPVLAPLPLPAPRAIEVRMALEGEGASAADVVAEVYDEYGFTWEPEGYHRDLYQLGDTYLRTGGAFFLAIDVVTARPVGTSALFRFDRLAAGEKVQIVDDVTRIAGADCSLERLYVRKSARSVGLGRALLQRTIDFAAARGARCLEIWSDKRFREAHRLYERFGATAIGERICDDPDRSPEWGLKIQLG